MTTAPAPHETASERGTVWLAGAAASLGGSAVTLPLLPPLSALLALGSVVLALVAVRAHGPGRARVTAVVICVLGAVLLLTSAGISSAMSVGEATPEPAASIPASPVPEPD